MIKDDGSVKDNETAAAAAAAAAATAVNVAASGLEFDIADSVPKSMKTKALRLVDRLRNDPAIQWNDRGELIHEGVAVAGSNIEDLVHDILRKRKTSVLIGWQKFARQLKRINLPMELVGNPDRRQYIQQAASSPTWTSRVRLRRRVDRSSTSGSRQPLWESF